jgi:hypothetical protein
MSTNSVARSNREASAAQELVMRQLLLIASLSLITACAGGPETAAATGSGATATPDGEKKICRRMTPVGSNMSKNVCATAAEWAIFDKEGRDDVDELNRRREQTNDTGGGGGGLGG